MLRPIEYRVGFSRKNHLFARAIRFFTNSQASHCYLRKITPDADIVFESTGKGASMRPYSVFLAHGPEVLAEYRIRLATFTLDRAWDHIAERFVDTPYAVWQIVGDAYCETAEALTGKRPKNPLAQKATVCSELVLLFLRRARIPKFDRFNANTVTPEDLWQIISDYEDYFAEVAS